MAGTTKSIVRLAILADTHGNLPALEAVLEDAEGYGPHGYIVAGDIIGGPQAVETLDLLQSLDSWMIRGNGDNYFLTYDAGEAPPIWYQSDLWANLRWLHDRLGRGDLDRLASLPAQRTVVLNGSSPVRVVHGSPWSDREFLYPDQDLMALAAFGRAGLLPSERKVPKLDALLSEIEEAVLVCAHSHIQWVQESRDLLVVNPGSVGASNNGDPRAHYALLTWDGNKWAASLRAVPYDLGRIRRAYRDTGLLEAGGIMAEAFLLGIVTGENVPGRFVAHLRRLTTAAGGDPDVDISDHIWRKAVATFDWGDRDNLESPGELRDLLANGY
jgi:predicted phosphodiesterase